MTRRTDSLSNPVCKSHLDRRRRSLTYVPTALALAFLSLNQGVQAANTQYNVINGKTDLTATATYTTGGTLGTGASGTAAGAGPTVTSDVTFNSGVAYNPAAFTLNSSQTFGSLNDLSTTTLSIANTSASGTGDTLTLGGSSDPGSSEPGSASGDLFFVGTGATLNINSGAAGSATALGIVLGQSGNFDIAGTSTISAAITSTGTANLTRTGSGLLTLSGGINNAGTFTNSGTATAVYPSVGTGTAPAGSTFLNGTVGANVTGIVQNGTSDLVLGNLGNTYNAGITIQNGVVVFNNTAAGSSNSLGKSTNAVFLGNGSTTTNATMDFAATVGGGVGGAQTFSNPVTVGSKTGEGANVISASDFNLALSGPISLTNGDLTLAPFNTGASSITVSGGITGTGNVFVSDVANNAGNVVNFTTAPVNNSGTITFNSATVNGVAVGTNNTGTNTITGGVGSNVTAITTSAAKNPLTISTNALVVNSGGTTLTNANTTSGVFTVSGGVAGTGNLTLNNNSSIANGITVSTTNVNNIGSITNSGTGTGGTLISSVLGSNVTGLTQNSAGTLTLSGTNLFIGDTTLTAGTLNLQNTSALQYSVINTNSTAGLLTIGASAVNTTAITLGGLNGTGSATAGSFGNLALVNLASTPAAVNLTIGNSNASYASNTLNPTYSGIISGAGGSLTKIGTNTQTLAGANTYTGTTAVNGGTLAISGAGSLNGTTGTALSLGGGTLSYSVVGGTQNFTGTTIAPGTSGVTVGASGETVNLGTTTRNVGGAVNFGTAGTITTSLPNANGIIGGYATVGGTNFAVNNTPGSAITPLTTYNATFPTVTSDTVTANNDNEIGATTLSANSTINSLTISDTGNNTLALGANSLTFTAGGGLLYAGNGSGGGSYTISGTGIIGAGANEFIANVNSGATLTISAPVIGAAAGTLTAAGGGTLVLTGNSVYTGPTFIGGGTLQIGNATATTLGGGTYAGAITNNGALVFKSTSGNTLSGIISGAGSLIQNGTGALTLSGANTYTGGTTVTAGTLKIGNAAALGGNTGAVSVAAGAALDLNGTTMTNTNALSLQGTGISNGGALTNSSGTAGTYAGLVTLGSTGVSIGGTGLITLSNVGTITGSGDNLTLTGTGGTIASIIGTGAGTLTANATGTWTLSGANTYTGGTTVTAGTLKIGNAAALGGNTGAVSVAAGAALDLNGTTMTRTNALSLQGTGISNGGALTNSSGTAGTYAGLVTLGSTGVSIGGTGLITLSNVGTITGSGDNLTLTGTGGTIASIIGTGAGTLTANATGTWTLSGANTYTGATNLNSGALTLSGGGSLASTVLNLKTGTFNYSSTAGSTQSFTTTNLTGYGVINNTVATNTLNLGTITHSSTTIPGAVNFANTTGAITTTNSNDSSGILAPWATIGTGTALNYAVSNGGSSAITAYTTGTNQASLTAAGGGTAGTTNFTLGNAGVTLTGSATGNTLQVLNTDVTGIVLALGTNNLTLNGILNSGGASGGLTISGGGKLFIGGNNELDISNNAQSTTISSIIADNGSTASSVVYSPVGAGTLTLSGVNTYTGGTFVNSGTLNIGNTSAKLGTGAVTLAAGTTLSTNGNNATESTFAPGGITGAGNFTASGGANGTITLDKINTYTGTTNVGGARNAIKVNIASTYDPVTGVQTGSALGLNSPINIAATVNESALWLNGNNITVGTITGGNSTNQSIPSAIVLGKTSGTSAALTVGGDNGSGTFNGNISDAAFSNNIGGIPLQGASSTGGSLIKIGTGTQTLFPGNGTGSPSVTYNNYGGPTVVNGGTLAGSSTEFYTTGVDKGGAFGLNSNVTVNSLTAGTTASLAINSTNVAAIGSLTFGGTGATATSTNNVSIGSGLLLLGGDVTADATNNPRGATITATASQGVLELGASRTFTIGSSTNSGGADLTIGAIIDDSSTAGTTTSTVPGTLAHNGTAGPFGITKAGAGVLVLTATNTYSGGTTVNQGTLDAFNTSALGASTGALAVSGGTLDIGTFSETVGAVTLSSGTIQSTGSTTASLTGTSYGVQSGTVSAVLAGSAALTKTAAGTVTLSGVNTYSGGTTITAGTLQLGNGTTGKDGTVTGAISDNSSLVFDYFGSATTPGVISGSGTVSTIGAGTAVLTGANTYSGGTTITAGTLQLGNGTSGNDGTVTGAITDNSSLAFDYFGSATTPGVISGTGAVSVIGTGTGTAVLTGANTYTGVTTITSGILSTGTTGSLANGLSASSIGASSSAASNLVFNGGTLQYANTTGTAARTDRLFTLGFPGGTLDASGTGTITFAGPGTIAISADMGARTLTLTGSNTGLNTFTPVIADASAGSGSATNLAKTSTGTWVLTGTNTYTGTTTVSGGTLQVGNGTSGSISNSSASAVSGGMLAFNEANGGSYTSTIGTTSPGLVVGAEGTGVTNTLGGVISGSGGFSQTGAGTTILTATNTYTGTTTVSGGTLSLFKAGTVGSSTGGTLAASGTGIVVNTSGTLLLSANNSVGNTTRVSLGSSSPATSSMVVANGVLQGRGAQLTATSGTQPVFTGTTSTTDGNSVPGLGALTLTNSTTLAFVTGGGAADSGTVVFSSFSDPSNSYVFNVTGDNFANPFGPGTSRDGVTERLIFATDESAFLGDFTFNGVAGAAEISLDGTFFEIVPVPEPATYLGGLLLMAAAGWQFRRQRRQVQA